MRVLLVNQTARVHTGGANRVVAESLDWLKQAGHDAALAYCDGGPSEVNAPVFPFAKPLSAEHGRSMMGPILEAFRPEVVQLHWADHQYLGARLGRDVPTCWFIHDQSPFCSGGDRMRRDFTPCHRPHAAVCLFWHYAQGCGGKHPLGNWRRWRLTQAHLGTLRDPALRLQVGSKFMRRGLCENHCPPERIDLVPLFASPASVPDATEAGRLIVASRLVRGKGVDLLLQALSRVSQPAWRLTVLGDGPWRGKLQTLADSLGLLQQVEFTGELPPTEVANWYARASLVVHPTLRPEPFGLVGPEAMAHAKPVVAFDGGATEEWLRDSQTGVVVRERTPEAMAQAIRALLSDPARAQKLGAQALSAWEQFRPERFLEALLGSFQRCRAQFAGR